MREIQKPTTLEKQKAISIFKSHYQGFKTNYGMTKIDIDTTSDNSIKLYRGIEKTCIVSADLPWVIKCDTYKGDERTPCMVEAKNFQRAQSWELEEYFAPTYYIGQYDGVDLILQKKLRVDSEYTRSNAYKVTGEDVFAPYTYNYSNGEKVEWYPTWNSDGLDQTDILVGLYNDGDLLHFCRKYRINDLHDGNFGWDGDTPYITDFSGYHDEDATYYSEEDFSSYDC